MTKKMSRYLAVAAASLSIAAGAAYAAQSTSPQGPQGGPPMHGMHGPHDHFMREAMQLHGMLKLNASQEKLWQSALDTMKQNREAMRANHEQMRNQMKSVQQQPILDLNAMHAQHEQIEAKDHQLREQTSAAWLNFYNALNDQQKTIVSTSLKLHWAKMEERHHHMHGSWGHHGGEHGEHGPGFGHGPRPDAPPPPAPAQGASQ